MEDAPIIKVGQIVRDFQLAIVDSIVIYVRGGFKVVEQGDHRHGGKVDGKVAESLVTWPDGIPVPWHEIDRIAATQRGPTSSP